MADQTQDPRGHRFRAVEDLERAQVAKVVSMATGVPAMADQAVEGMEQAAARIREMNEEMIRSAASSGRWVLDTYEKTLRTMLDFHLASAEATQIQWVNAMARAQAQFLLELSSFYTKAARDLLG